MSWIDETDIQRIKEISDAIHEKNDSIGRPGVPCCPIRTYGFNTPNELQKELSDIWEKLGKEYMKEFGVVVSISAFKNKEVSVNDDVSVFNYEF